MYVLENEDDIIEAVSSLILELELDWTIVTPWDIELLNLLSCEGINTELSSIFYLHYLKCHKLVDENALSVHYRLGMDIDFMFYVVGKHETLKTNVMEDMTIWFSFLPIYSRLIFVFFNHIHNCTQKTDACMILSHFWRELVN